MHDYALVLNAGSSSLKLSVCGRLKIEDWRLESRSQIEGVRKSRRISARDAAGRILIDQRLDTKVCDGIHALVYG
jgi:acetate kinase